MGLVLGNSGIAQENQQMSALPMSTQESASVAPSALKDLMHEAEQNNPEIAAAERGYTAATHIARQASALPDTQVMVQQFSVGSPRPFAGYTNSEFAYIGIGASQEIPYPGKRGLRTQVANGEAGVRHTQIESVRKTVVEKLKAGYFQLAYLQQTLPVLERNDRVLKDVEQIVESQYRVGKGNQQEVLKAQLQLIILQSTSSEKSANNTSCRNLEGGIGLVPSGKDTTAFLRKEIDSTVQQVALWQSNTAYAQGANVAFDGGEFTAIQAHTSQTG
ncbi:MAG TPA: TolC family protein [Candidatus Angelobacter sp.]|nr:TolC family protein [Candidatus Angelobacter sp.]